MHCGVHPPGPGPLSSSFWHATLHLYLSAEEMSPTHEGHALVSRMQVKEQLQRACDGAAAAVAARRAFLQALSATALESPWSATRPRAGATHKAPLLTSGVVRSMNQTQSNVNDPTFM